MWGMHSENLRIPCPTESEVRKYIKIWDNDENYRKPAEALQKLFTEYLPTNKHIEDILIKTHALNDAYGTNVFWPVAVAENILAMKIDDDLSEGEISVIEKIAKKNGKEKFEFQGKNGKKIKREFYSFATKYASFHQPEIYPLFDSNVKTALIYFKKHCGFEFNGDLRKYENFVCIIENFKKNFSLNFSFRDIDKYLYRVGRELNPPKKKS